MPALWHAHLVIDGVENGTMNLIVSSFESENVRGRWDFGIKFS